jgi:hypothetical protein
VGTGNYTPLIARDVSSQALLLKPEFSHQIRMPSLEDSLRILNDSRILVYGAQEHFDVDASPFERWLRDPPYTPGWRGKENGLENDPAIVVEKYAR